MNSIVPELYCRSEASLAEGPVWDAETLYWVDIPGQTIWIKKDFETSARSYPVGLEVGSLCLWKDRRLVLATQQGFQSFDVATAKLEPLAHPETLIPGNRFNDGKCDPRGRFVAGSMDRAGAPGKGALYLLDVNRSVRKIFEPVSCPNGLAWSANGTEFYHVDTPTGVVRSFTYDLDTGGLSAERAAIEIPARHGRPDGMTIDQDGNLWIALWDGWGVECWDPRSGRRLQRIELPTARVTSCVFGGRNYDLLFITTAKHGLDETVLGQQELAGSIFCARCGATGRAPVHFQGKP